MRRITKPLAIAGSVAALVAITSATTAVASTLIGSKDIKDGGVHRVDLGEGVQTALNQVGAPGQDGQDGKDGIDGKDGLDGKDGTNGLLGAYYSQAFYDVGDTNAGAIATVACQDTTDVAISGGVQVLGLDAGANSRNTPVSSSFPGRMDWGTNTPKADRLDGWIVQFGGNAGATSDVAPEKTVIWALCVPNADVSVVNTYTQSD